MTTTTNTEFAPVEHTIHDVWTGARSKIEAKTVEMNKRLAKLGAPAATVTFGPIVEKSETDPVTGYTTRWTEFETVTVTGFTAKISGWEPVASLDHTFHTADGNDEALTTLFPAFAEDDEFTLPEEFRRIGRGCDHCGTDRKRKTTVLFRSDDDEWINVGTSCLRDFIGVTPATILWLSNWAADFDDDDEFRVPAEAMEPDPIEVLTIAAAITDSSGFVRSGEGGSTRDLVATIHRDGKLPTNRYGLPLKPEWDSIDWEASKAKAEAIAEWTLAKADEPGASDYFRNGALAIRARRAPYKVTGLLASLPFSYNREMAIISEREAKLAARPTTIDEHLGAIGDKLVLRPVTIVKAIRVETMYGTSLRVTGITAEGHKVTTFGSGDTLWGVDPDDIVEWRGTIKAHNASDKYGVETEFARVKLLDLPSDVDFTKVAKPGDTVKATVTGRHHTYDLEFPREAPDGWVFDADTNTVWARVDKVRKVDDRFVYITNTPTGWFTGAEIEVVDPDEIPAWRMTDTEVKRELSPWSYRPDDDDRVTMGIRVRKWYEARGVGASDELVAETLARHDALLAEVATGDNVSHDTLH